jgi:hypothetical protein
MQICWAIACIALGFASVLFAADVPELQKPPGVVEISQPTYYWKTNNVGKTAQLLTLFCGHCGLESEISADVPLVAILRDTLGDNDPENDRITDVWLLTYSRPKTAQRLLAAIPFFYWRVGDGSPKVGSNLTPLLDLDAPQHPVLAEVRRDLLQWILFDPLTMAVRASSRAYRSNEYDHERLHLEEAIDYLSHAPVGNDASAPTRLQLDTVIARLELRKRLLGGLVAERRAANVGQREVLEQVRVRARNWELLRECADRTGLYFEPLSLAGGSDQYAILWFPLEGAFELPATSLASVWKLLDIKNPWTDKRLKNWQGPVYTRVLDEEGALLPPDKPGRTISLVPLAIYSLDYPRNPLLLIDFRNKLHVRRHEMMQRSVNEVTAGVIGISHFTNWYYYVGADLYDFVKGRHGSAVDQAERLDCYSEFRVQLALDHSLDPALRNDIERRMGELALNPLDASPTRELEAARKRYARLVYASDDKGRVVVRLDKQRRAEIVSFRQSPGARAFDTLLHAATLGLYTRQAQKSLTNLAMLDIERRVSFQLNFLDTLLAAGTQPEIACEPSRIQASLAELRQLMPFVQSRYVEKQVSATLERLNQLTEDTTIKSEASLILASLQNAKTQPRSLSVPGIAAAFTSGQ